jgi:hypothetical protein
VPGRGIRRRRPASRAAPSAIRVISQAAMPPVVTTWTVVAGTGATPVVPPCQPGGGTTAAKAAGTMGADTSRPQVTAVSRPASRHRRAPALRAAAGGWIFCPERCAAHRFLLSAPSWPGSPRPATWLPPCPATSAVTTRAGPQETHRIAPGACGHRRAADLGIGPLWDCRAAGPDRGLAEPLGIGRCCWRRAVSPRSLLTIRRQAAMPRGPSLAPK